MIPIRAAWDNLRAYASPGVVAPVFLASLVTTALSFAVPLTVLQAYDRIIAYRSVHTLAWLSGACIVAIVFGSLASYWRDSVASWSAARFARRCDKRLAEAAMRAEASSLAGEEAERHLERFRSTGPMSAALIGSTLPVLAELPFALAYGAIVLIAGKSAATPSFIAVALELTLVPLANSLVLALSREAASNERDRVAFLVYALERVHFIKAQALERIALAGYRRVQAGELAASHRLKRVNRLIDEAGRVIMACSMFGTILWGGYLVADGALTIGAVSACLFFSSRLVGLARDARKAALSFADAWANFEEVELGTRLLARPNANELGLPRSADGRLEFDAVESGSVAGLSFVVRPGEAALIRAPAGTSLLGGRAWESSVCAMAAGLALPTKGTVLVDAYPSARWNFLGGKGVVSCVSDRSAFLPGTLLENMCAFDPGRRESALDAAELLGLAAIVSRLPKGFETVVSPGEASSLSASARRLVCIVRSVSRRPRLLVWDHADADLDGEALAAARKFLLGLKGGTTLLIATADALLGEIADLAVPSATPSSRGSACEGGTP